MIWQDVLSHRSLQDLPFKIELNERGQIVMTPISNRQGRLKAKLAIQLHKRGGESLINCVIDTMKGTKVADVAWLSEAFIEALLKSARNLYRGL